VLSRLQVSSEELQNQLAADGGDLGKQLERLMSSLTKKEADISTRLKVSIKELFVVLVNTSYIHSTHSAAFQFRTYKQKSTLRVSVRVCTCSCIATLACMDVQNVFTAHAAPCMYGCMWAIRLRIIGHFWDCG
jgi:hypothetical protein